MRQMQLAAIIVGLVLTSGVASAQSAVPVTKTTTTRHYDCTKAGNANKAACKSAVPAVAPAAAPTPVAPAPAAKTVSTHTVQRSTTTQTASAAGPTGATAICNDGTYSHSAHHSGSCSRHKGVKQFY